MSMYDKTHFNTVISLQLKKINGKKKIKKYIYIVGLMGRFSQLLNSVSAAGNQSWTIHK